MFSNFKLKKRFINLICAYEKPQTLTNALLLKIYVIQMQFAIILLEITRVVVETVFLAAVSLVQERKHLIKFFFI